jgi:hypothetical protein
MRLEAVAAAAAAFLPSRCAAAARTLACAMFGEQATSCIAATIGSSWAAARLAYSYDGWCSHLRHISSSSSSMARQRDMPSLICFQRVTGAQLVAFVLHWHAFTWCGTTRCLSCAHPCFTTDLTEYSYIKPVQTYVNGQQ